MLDPETYNYAKLDCFLDDDYKDTMRKALHYDPTIILREEEAITMICTKEMADFTNIDRTFPCRKISLKVHSSLDAVGLTAAIAQRLTNINIGCNVVAGFYHDHIFVPVGREDEVMAELMKMSEEQR